MFLAQALRNPLRTLSRVCLLFLFLISMAACDAAEPGASETTDDATPTYISTRRLPESVTLARLSNGLTVIVQENHVAPVATVRCYVKNTGGAFEGKYLGAGLSHVLEHVVSGGTTTTRSEKEIEHVIDRFGGATNAYTSSALTSYFIDCPAKETSAAVDLVADAMQHCAFNPEEFARELEVVKREIADGQANRQRVLWKAIDETIYQVHPMRHPIIGYLDVLSNVKNEEIIDFYRRRYVPNNQVFVVVGDIETQTILDQVARLWTGTPRGPETVVPFPDEPKQIAPRETIREMDGKAHEVVLAWPTVKLSHPDLYALDVASYILTQGDSSRLTRELKYERGLVLSVDSASYTPHFVDGFFAVFATTSPEKADEAVRRMGQAVYRLRDELVSQAELDKAKKQKSAELVFERQTVQQAAESLGRSYLSAGDPLFDETYVEGIQQVTVEEIRDVARRHFTPTRQNYVAIVPKGTSQTETIAATDASADEVRLVTLPNGVRVLLKRHTHLPLINMRAFVLGGSLVDDPTTAGRSALLGKMLDQGTASHSAKEIAEYFDSVGGTFSTGAGRNTLLASTTVLKEDFPQAATLLAECFTQPAFPEEKFERIKQLTLEAIDRRSDDPQSEAFEVLYDHLPVDSPYHVIQGGKRESVERLTTDDLRDYHRCWFHAQNMVVTIFGDIEPDEALAIADKHFGHLSPRADALPIPFDRDNTIVKSTRQHKKTGKPIGVVLMAYPTAGILSREDHAAMTVLDAMMSGYGYPGGWLHNDLRGAGLVYFVHAMPLTGPAPGFFLVLAQTQPTTVDDVITRVDKHIARARDGDFTPEECTRARQMVLALHAQDNTTISSQAQQAALDELYGLGHAYDTTFDARIEAVTREDILRVAGKYLNERVLVTTSP